MEASDIHTHQEKPETEFILNAGNLASIASFHRAIANRLIDFNDQYRSGDRPRVRLNLTSIQPRKMSMAGLTALLTIVDRLREFSRLPVLVDVNWNPEIFGFWEDTGFFEIGRKRDLFEWQEGMAHGYSYGKTNPNTKLLFFELPDTLRNNHSDRPTMKDEIRNEVKEKLLLLCGELFRPKRGARAIPSTLRDQVAVTSAELVVNAHLWGEANAFVGLQRSSNGITVCVCDSGKGFYKSLLEKRKPKFAHIPTSHLESLALGCINNYEDFGLRRAIDMVVRFGGKVEVSSYSAEIVWQHTLWDQWTKMSTYTPHNPAVFQESFAKICAQFMIEKLSSDGRQMGYCRNWTTPLRGTRVSFEIPIS